MFTEFKKLLIFIVCVLIFGVSLIAGCSENVRMEPAQVTPTTQAMIKQDDSANKIVIYNERQVVIPEPSRKEYENIKTILNKVTGSDYGIVKWGDGGNNEIVSNTRTEQGILLILAEPVDITIAGEGSGSPSRNIPCKRLYLPLSGSLAKNNAIILSSPSEYGWDWSGLSAVQLNEFNEERNKLKEIVSKLPRKERNDW